SLIQGNISSQENWDEEAFRYNEEIHQELLSQVSTDSQAIFLAETIFLSHNNKRVHCIKR
ncbi:MAG: hypothetical protein IJP28_05185, partial [Erysipelotrichales bacterium]|nr:hypothetical protein [Erysipelotrichales bacterium]